MILASWIGTWLLLAVVAGASGAPPVSGGADVRAAEARGATSRVHGDADDCAIWVDARNAARSLVIGTDKAAGRPGLFVWDVGGRALQFVAVPRPNNVDVRQGVRLGDARLDLVVCNARATREMRVFRVDAASRTLVDVTTAGGIPTPELADPYGLCLWVRPGDGAVFVIQSTQAGRSQDLHQYRLEPDGAGRVRGVYVRAFGAGSIRSVAEGMVADDELGWVWVADEDHAVRKYDADPDGGGGGPLASFALGDEVAGDREGLALYRCSAGRGFLLLSSQGDGTVKVYRREGEPDDPHRHRLLVTIATRGSSSTDGLDVVSSPLPGYPQGLLAKHHSRGRNFVLYSWADMAQPPLEDCAASSGGASR